MGIRAHCPAKLPRWNSELTRWLSKTTDYMQHSHDPFTPSAHPKVVDPCISHQREAITADFNTLSAATAERYTEHTVEQGSIESAPNIRDRFPVQTLDSESAKDIAQPAIDGSASGDHFGFTKRTSLEKPHTPAMQGMSGVLNYTSSLTIVASLGTSVSAAQTHRDVITDSSTTNPAFSTSADIPAYPTNHIDQPAALPALTLSQPSHFSNTQPSSLPSVPHLQPCSNKWKDFPALLEEARSLGARETGVFLVDMPPELAGYSWKGMSSDTVDGTTPERSTARNMVSYRWSVPQVDTEAYTLKAEVVKMPFDLTKLPSPTRESNGSNLAQKSLTRFEDEVRKAHAVGQAPIFPHYAANQEVDGTHQRISLGLDPQCPISELNGNTLDKTVGRFAGVHTSMAYISADGFGAPFGMHKEDFDLLAVNYLVRGSPKVWVVVAPADANRLEELMLHINGQKRQCDQFVRHVYTWLPTHLLEEAGIRYSTVYQQQHQAVVTDRRSYHQGINCGMNIAEAVNYGDESWSSVGCQPCHPTCGSDSTDFITEAAMAFKEQRLKRPSRAKQNPKEQTVDASEPKALMGPRQKRKYLLKSTESPLKKLRRVRDGAISKPKVSHDAAGIHVAIKPYEDRLLARYVTFEEEEQKRMARKVESGCLEASSEPAFSPVKLFDELAKIPLKDKLDSNRLPVPIGRDQVEKVVRLVTATAGRIAISVFREITNHFRTQTCNSIFTSANPSLGARVTVLRTLNSQGAYCNLIRRFHVVKLVEQLDGKFDRFVEVSLGSRGRKPRRAGNPNNAAQSAAKEEAIEQALREAYPDIVGSSTPATALKHGRFSQAWNEIKQNLERNLKLGRRWKILTDEYGLGVLPLIPAIKENTHSVSDYM